MPVFPLDLNGMYFFSQVVEHRGFAAASRVLGIPRSRLSRQIDHLEQQLGLRLLQRNTRSIQVTDVGHEFYRYCVAMMQQAHAAQQATINVLTEPNGTVRFSVPPILASEIISPVLPVFMSRFPQVNVEVYVAPRRVNIIEEGLDFTLRGLGNGNEPSGLIQRRIGTAKWVLVASPAFIKKYGVPDTPHMLSNYSCLLYPPSQGVPGWKLYGPAGEVVQISFSPRLSSDNLEIILHAVIGGYGICGMPYYACRHAIAKGELQEVLCGWHPQNGELVLLYPSRRGVHPAVKALIEFFCETIPPMLSKGSAQVVMER